MSARASEPTHGGEGEGGGTIVFKKSARDASPFVLSILVSTGRTSVASGAARIHSGLFKPPLNGSWPSPSSSGGKSDGGGGVSDGGDVVSATDGGIVELVVEYD